MLKHSIELVGLHTGTLHSIIHGPVSPWQRGGIGQNFRTEESLRYRADLEEEARQKEEQRRGKDWKWPALLCKFSDGRFDQFVVYGGIRWPMLLCTYIFSLARHRYVHSRYINIRACCMHICPILFQKRMDYRWLQTETCIRSCSRNHSESSSTKSYPNGSNLRRHLMEAGIPGMSVKVQSENAGVSADFDTFWCSSIIIKWGPECSVEDLPSTSIRTSCATFNDKGKSEGHLVLMVMVCEANLNLFARSLQLLNEAAWEPLGVTFVFLLHRSFEAMTILPQNDFLLANSGKWTLWVNPPFSEDGWWQDHSLFSIKWLCVSNGCVF